MATANTFSTPNNTVGNLNGFFKEVYADKLGELIPDGVILLKDIKFNGKDKSPGNLYHQPVILGLEHGVTFASPEDDGFNLNAPIASQIKDAQVRGCPAVLRSLLGYSAASRAQGSQAAFMDVTKYIVSNMLRSMSKKLEIELLYGQMGYATVNASTSAATTFVVTLAEWAPGIWAGAEGMPIEIRDATGATSRGEYTVAAVDMDTRTVTLNAAATLTATDVVWHKGAYGNEFAGVHKILSQTTGTLFNINVASFGIFRGNSYAAGGAALSQSKMGLALARAVEKGLDSKVTAMVNPKAWTNMMNDQAALRKFDSSYKSAQATNGMEKLEFHSQNGVIEIRPSIYIKEGYAFLLDMAQWLRVGSQEISFKMPGSGDDYVLHRPDAAGYEMRLFTDQALFCQKPGTSVVITGIVNAT